ncbi:MAG: glutamine-hydrolyzing carbamoyl-phosphate synthase small subunit [Bacillota bacterium]|nr:glutamine-hydrolyzing carbamoyl-phosphate synthase small subunit [Bacillota bacterium]
MKLLSARRGLLALEDGSVFSGELHGEGPVGGEVVFNTSMTGYQEILTDPSYAGQIITMTYPLIGNYGANSEDQESLGVHARGLVVRELCAAPNYWRAERTLAEYLQLHGVVALSGVDTRALTRRLRERGTMRGMIAPGDADPMELVEAARHVPALGEQDLVAEVTTRNTFTAGVGEKRVAVLDFGCKGNIVECLVAVGLSVTVFPAATPADEILAAEPAGVILSNGPGDPKAVPYAVATVRELLGKAPLFGICLGHQILGLALGGDTYKLKFGHRGANHPVKDLATGRVYITAQNHGYAVDPESLPADAAVSHVNLNDRTVEGLVHRQLPAFSLQYHPEASPGPHDSEYLFARFLELMER